MTPCARPWSGISSRAPTPMRPRPALACARPGVGTILALVLLDEIPASHRFPRVQEGVSSGRLVKGAQEAAGQRDGPSGKKIGKASLTWAFADAAGLCWRNNPAGQRERARLEKTQSTGKARTVLAPTLA